MNAPGEASRPTAQSGQCLTEMIMILPLFMILLAGVLAYMSAIDWRESVSESATIMRLGILEKPNLARADNNVAHQVGRLFERSRRISRPTTLARQQQPPRQGLRKYLSNCAELKKELQTADNDRPRPNNASMAFCTDGGTLVGAPLPTQRLAPHSPALRALLAMQPQLRERVQPVFDSWAPFSSQKRSSWDARVSARAKFRWNQRAFVARIASGGSEKTSPRYNLTRDCFFAAQGMICQSEDTRRYSEVHDLFTQQRQISQSVQIAGCAAEACARTPEPISCALNLAVTLAALAAENLEPQNCPIVAKSIKALHESQKLVLTGYQKAEQFDAWRRASRVDTVGSMY